MMDESNRGPGMIVGDAIDLEKIPGDEKLSTDRNSQENNEETDLEKAIELTGFGWYYAGFILLCGSCIITMVFETMGISFILPAAQCDLSLTTREKGYLSGVTFFGMVVSAHMWGFCADTFGRKKILLISIAGAWSFSFTSSFAPTAAIFIAFRFFTGFFLCGNTSTVYAYLSEFLHTGNRSKIMTWTCGGVAGAYLFIPGLAWILIPKKISWDLGFVVFTSWRIYVVVLGGFSLIAFLAFLYFPESPKFLMSVGRRDDALKILKNIYAMNTGNSADKYPVKILKFESNGSSMNSPTSDNPESSSTSYSKKSSGLVKVMWRQTAPLFKKPYGYKTLLFCSIQFGLYLSSGGLYLWMPNLLNTIQSTGKNNSLINDKSPETICEFVAQGKSVDRYNEASNYSTECNSEIRSEVYMSTLVVGALYLLTYSSYGALVSKFGNKTVAVSVLFLGGIAGIGSYFARDEITMTLLLSGCVVLTGTCISVLSAAIVDAYPTNLRAMAVSLALTCGRLGSGVAGNVVGILIESYCDFAIIGLGCVVLVCSLSCNFLSK